MENPALKTFMGQIYKSKLNQEILFNFK